MLSISSTSQRINNVTQFITKAVLFTLIFLILELLFFSENSSLFIFSRFTYINFCLTILIALRNNNNNNNSLNIYSLTINISSEQRIPFLMTLFINAILNWVLIFLNIFGRTFSRKDSY